MDPGCFSPAQVAENFTETICVKKAKAPFLYLLVLGVLAGVYIAFGGMIATLAGFESATHLGTGLSKIFSGGAFSVGLMLVVIGGAELFTGNNLILLSALNKNIPWSGLFRNWFIVYFANFIGALFIAWLYFESGLWKTTGTFPESSLGANALKIAVTKVNLPFTEALARGILCNWLVCLAVWLATASKEVISKIFAIFFPIMTFVALGFEHSIANMYFIPLGMMLKNPLVDNAGIAAEKLAKLNWNGFLIGNLLPVTIGNIIGGAFFVGFLYWIAYVRKIKKAV